jgi:hypothetical protein
VNPPAAPATGDRLLRVEEQALKHRLRDDANAYVAAVRAAAAAAGKMLFRCHPRILLK